MASLAKEPKQGDSRFESCLRTGLSIAREILEIGLGTDIQTFQVSKSVLDLRPCPRVSTDGLGQSIQDGLYVGSIRADAHVTALCK